jgi:hypothetical protein
MQLALSIQFCIQQGFINAILAGLGSPTGKVTVNLNSSRYEKAVSFQLTCQIHITSAVFAVTRSLAVTFHPVCVVLTLSLPGPVVARITVGDVLTFC